MLKGEIGKKGAFFLSDIVDDTFEIQFRTTLSEGWHEVDHNLRYKCQYDWKELKGKDRMLNGIYATLETSDQSLVALFEDIAYNHYKKELRSNDSK